jgi:uncharacterized protein YjbJ (UPF0337 family)
VNWEQTKGQWNQAKGALKKQWGKLTDDDLTVIAGQRDQLVGKIQERYGIAKEEADKRIEFDQGIGDRSTYGSPANHDFGYL